jgi:hypothetical protein
MTADDIVETTFVDSLVAGSERADCCVAMCLDEHHAMFASNDCYELFLGGEWRL